MAVIEGSGALIALAARLKSGDDPDDEGPLAEASAEMEALNKGLFDYVKRSGKAVKGKVTITIGLKAFKEGDEVREEIEVDVKRTAIPTVKRKNTFWLDDSGAIETKPVRQVEMNFTPQVVQGGAGKGNEQPVKPATKAV